MSEVWRSVAGAERYEVSSLGRVRNVKSGRILKPQPSGKNGEYRKVHLGRARQNVQVHRLVCETFHGPPPVATDHADHVDFDTANNAAENLRWLRAYLNIGRQLRWGTRGWERVGDEEQPEGHTPLSDAERAEIEDQITSQGW